MHATVRCLLVAWLALAAQTSGRADSWLPPSTKSYESSDHRWRLTVTPKPITSQLAYFTDKVASRPNAGAAAGDPQRTAVGRMEHLEGGRWQMIWAEDLVNEVAPVGALLSEQGQVATFDDWHGMGTGPNVVVLYDLHGRVVRKLALTDIVPQLYVHALPHSVSSIGWGGKHRFSPDGKQLILAVAIPSDPEDAGAQVKPEIIEIALDAMTGQVLAPLPGPWAKAWQAALAVRAKIDALEAPMWAEFKAPLPAPSVDRNGTRYLYDACGRVEPEINKTLHLVAYLPDDATPETAQRSIADLLKRGDASEELGPLPPQAFLLGAADPNRLLDALAAVLAKHASKALAKGYVCLTVTPATLQRARDLVAPTGARLVALDIARPTPQSAERLQWLEDRRRETLDSNLPWAR